MEVVQVDVTQAEQIAQVVQIVRESGHGIDIGGGVHGVGAWTPIRVSVVHPVACGKVKQSVAVRCSFSSILARTSLAPADRVGVAVSPHHRHGLTMEAKSIVRLGASGRCRWPEQMIGGDLTEIDGREKPHHTCDDMEDAESVAKVSLPSFFSSLPSHSLGAAGCARR